MADQSTNGSSNGRPATFSRLPKNVVPSHYSLTLEPDLDNFTFTGTESVTIDVKEATKTIILNAAELEVTVATFEDAEGTKFVSEGTCMNVEEERATIKFAQELKPGKGKLNLSFTGILNDKMKGFYRSKCSAADAGCPDRYIATTQFEAIDARRAFPCWDEPAIKATFQVTLVAAKGLRAISNMPISSETTREDGKSVFQFCVTPVMSTYILAFVVGEFDYIECTSKNGVLVRVYSRPGTKEQGRLVLEIAPRALDFYTEYFNIPYPLPKMDFVSIPDFSAGAMENWGLTTAREVNVLYDPQNTSSTLKQRITIVVTHEMAHQWFGNLVTMEWWTHLWLNEGFASLMEDLCGDKLYPELRLMDQSVIGKLLVVLKLDSLKSSHPVEMPISNPSEIDEIFDEISYEKGACVITMLYNYLGDDDFRKGLSLYLNRFKHQNAETEDLWTALEEVSSKPVGQIMSTWTKQKGFPVISVSESQDGDNRILKLRQEKFTADGQLTAEEKEYLWMVPILVTCESSPDKVVAETILSSKSTELVVPNVKAGEWVKLNPGFGSIYRVQYSESMLEALVLAIKSKALPPLDRLNIVSDVFALAPAGRLSTVKALQVMEAFKDEDDFLIWSTLADCLSSVSLLVSNTEFDDAYRRWGRNFLSTIKCKVGWKKRADEKHFDSLLRGVTLSLLSAFNDSSVLEESKRLFDAYANDGVAIDADVRDVVYRSVAKQADEKTFNTILRLFRESDSCELKNELSAAVGCVRDASLVQKALDFSIGNEVRSQDTFRPLGSLGRHKIGREAAWPFFQEKVSLFNERYRGSPYLPRILKDLGLPYFASEEKAVEIKSFFEKNPLGVDMTVDQCVESIRLNAAWLARDREQMKSFFTAST